MIETIRHLASRSAVGCVRLAHLRAELSGTKEQQDAALVALRDADKIILYPEDDRLSLTKADNDAALYRCGGSVRYDLVYLTR